MQRYFKKLPEFKDSELSAIDGGGEDFEVIADDITSDDKEENEVIVIDSDDDTFDLGSDEVEFLGDSDINDSFRSEIIGIDTSSMICSHIHLHIDMLNILLPTPDPNFWASTYK
ncbi:unnamed protein product [Cuscuta campestris]|uniref:Uncharacterized protein n=1 Tax=Cuscuta campestris TaxID=132261 RepID=A0A484L3G3_9ASTE|nr:unnamed protein product [Cuscuta campestris]